MGLRLQTLYNSFFCVCVKNIPTENTVYGKIHYLKVKLWFVL